MMLRFSGSEQAENGGRSRKSDCIYEGVVHKEIGMAATEKKEFLARVDNTRFLVDFDGQYVTSTDTPSNAAHLSYAAANQWCQRLRKRGFPMAVVTDFLGNVATYEMLKAGRQAAQADKAEDSLPTTHKELDQLSAAEYRRRMSDPAFVARVNELEAQPRVAAGRRS
jgi:outer membrane receptor for Fe3+-dicitrate